MKILHIGLLSHFTENMTYQDNLLVEKNLESGHKVFYVSDNFKFISGILKEVNEEVVNKDDFTLYRLKLFNFLHPTINRKIVYSRELKKIIKSIEPDVIFHHGAFGLSLLTTYHYVKNRPNVKFIVDSHSDQYNGANNYIQKMVYKYILSVPLKIINKRVEKIYYISTEAKLFLRETMNINSHKLEFLPLGGEIIELNEKLKLRKQVLKELNLDDSNVLFMHSGKLSKNKKTIETLKAFSSKFISNQRLIVIGSVHDSIKEEFYEILGCDSRIIYLGWMDKENLYRYLAATDVYIQLGTQSATLQNAACMGAALIAYPYPSYKELFEDSIIYVNDENRLKEIFEQISNNSISIVNYKEKSFNIAKELLDYKVLANRYLL